MDFEERMEAELVSMNEKELIYKYGHFSSAEKMTGKLRITNTAEPSVSTVELEKGYKTRANEMRIAGKIILDHLLTGEWPKRCTLI